MRSLVGPLDVRRRWRLVFGTWVLLAGVATAAHGQGPRATAGWHLLRPGEDLRAVARRYLATSVSLDGRGAEAPSEASAAPGERVLVELGAGLPAEAAIVGRLAGRVEVLPAPVAWLRSRRFDLLGDGDAVRTFSSASAEVHFPDANRVLLTEESLVFLYADAPQHRHQSPFEIEIIEGQADLSNRVSPRRKQEGLEIVLGPARVTTKSNRAGQLEARARREPGKNSQMMVYRGSGEVEAAGTRVRVPEGSGSVIPNGGPPTPAEPLLAAPSLVSPADGARLGSAGSTFAWGAVARASSYTFELCLDAECAQLVERQTGIVGTSFALDRLVAGRYFWRVTARAASELDGFPSPSASLTSKAPPGGEGMVAEEGGAAENATLAGLVEIPSDAFPIIEDEIDVRPSRFALFAAEPTSPLELGRAEILALPHMGDDVIRAIPLLPGTAANDVSAQFHVRGGRRDEVGILLDGQELYSPFHLKDFDNALSIVAPAALGKVELSTGGLPARFGDRMGGVLELTTLAPAAERRMLLGLSFFNLQVGGSGSLGHDRGRWFALARRGSTELAGDFFDGKEKPKYWDALAKVDSTLGARQNLGFRALVSDDEVGFTEVDEEDFKRRDTHHGSAYLWCNHQFLLDAWTFADTLVSWSETDVRREAIELESDQDLEVRDRRSFDVFEVRQEWGRQLNERQTLTLGAGLRHFEAPYDYFSFKRYTTPVALIRAEPREGTLRFVERFSGDHWSLYASDRLRWGERAKLELGARFDRHTLLGESFVSPRVNLAVALGNAAVLRAGWGHFRQSQRPYELQVEDAETSFAKVERAEHALLGFERVFGAGSRLAGLSLRAEVYRREVDNPRRRFENLFEPFNTFPELEPDRVLVAPERSLSQGFEIFLRGAPERKLRWWLNYTLAASEDRVAGRWQPRQIDQTHALNLDIAFPVGKSWSMNVAWRLHTGWPTTALGFEVREVEDPDEGPGEDPGEEPELDPEEARATRVEIVPILGPLNAERLGTYSRVDLRASRRMQVRRGTFTVYLDVQNVFNRKNESGFDYVTDEEDEVPAPVQEFWPGIFPSLGFTWEF